MKKVILSLLSVQLLTDGGAVLITKKSTDNPSANGVHKITAGQFQRIVTRALGFYNPIAFKALIDVCNGSAKLSIDKLECKTGDAWENKISGEKGTYTKDWTKYSNHEVVLGIVGQMKIAEIAMTASLQLHAQSFVAPVSTSTRKEAVVAEVAEDNSQSEASAEETNV